VSDRETKLSEAQSIELAQLRRRIAQLEDDRVGLIKQAAKAAFASNERIAELEDENKELQSARGYLLDLETAAEALRETLGLDPRDRFTAADIVDAAREALQESDE
jgi:hypothetical protein